MPDFLLQLDRHLFHFINHDLANPFFDAVMPWLRDRQKLDTLFTSSLSVFAYGSLGKWASLLSF